MGFYTNHGCVVSSCNGPDENEIPMTSTLSGLRARMYLAQNGGSPGFEPGSLVYSEFDAKAQPIGEEKKLSNASVDNEGDAIFSPKGTIEPQSHHQISITTTVAAATGTPMKSIPIAKRSSSFKHTSIINPSRILFFFATMSSIGTIMLIYFTLSMAKHNKDNTS
ncbi:hypothetical protein HanIR_Chr11g0537461 [Helianthus annuus]|nr:hypothetical protein HanIR_Chr11g0537461 [Helianthus annuus]